MFIITKTKHHLYKTICTCIQLVLTTADMKQRGEYIWNDHCLVYGSFHLEMENDILQTQCFQDIKIYEVTYDGANKTWVTSLGFKLCTVKATGYSPNTQLLIISTFKCFTAAFKAHNGTVITVMANSKSHFLQTTFGKGNSSQVMLTMQQQCCQLYKRMISTTLDGNKLCIMSIRKVRSDISC